MFKKVVHNKIFINIIYSLTILLTFVFLFYKLRYAVVVYDDVLDLVINEFKFYHGRFYSELFALIFVRGIPYLIDWNIQDFAVVSQNILKSSIFCWLVFEVSRAFFCWKNLDNLKKAVLYLFSFVTIYLFLMSSFGSFIFETLQFFCGYILPIPILLIIWYKLSEYYIKGKSLTSFDSKMLILLALLVAQSNELVCILLFLLLSFIGIEKLIKRKRSQEKESYDWVLYPWVSIVLMCEIIYTHPGFLEIVSNYKSDGIAHNLFSDIFSYLYIYLDKIIVENIFIIVPIIMAIVLLCKYSEDKTERTKVLKYISYSFMSLFLFFISLFFIGKTCHYVYINADNYEPYWLLYQPFLFSFKVLLYAIGLFLLGYLFKDDSKRKIKVIVLLFFIVGSFVHIKSALPLLYNDIYSPKAKETQYLLDKLSVFYFERGETAILPKENLEHLFTIQKDNEIMPYDLKTGKYKNKIYYKQKDGSIWPYLLYLDEVYEVDNIEKGMTFTTKEKAIREYIKRGGVLEPEELEELDFSTIEEEL